MRKLSVICLWAFIVFLVLSFLFGIVAAILLFEIGDVAAGFSNLIWVCISGWVLAATIGVIAHEKEREGCDNNKSY